MSQPPPNLKESTPTGVFVSTITALKNGILAAELDDALREVTEAVAKTQLKGCVTLHLTVAPGGVGVGDAPLFKITPSVEPKTPKIGEKPQAFFVDEHFNLTRRNPNQMEDTRLTVVPDDRPQGITRAATLKSAANS